VLDLLVGSDIGEIIISFTLLATLRMLSLVGKGSALHHLMRCSDLAADGFSPVLVTL
jgi:hypothetical protein